MPAAATDRTDGLNSREQLSYLVRALSHDMSANFMLLEHSFSRLRQALDGIARPELDQAVADVEACLGESKRFLNDLAELARTGNVDMEPSRVELTDVVEETLFEQRGLLAGRNVEVEVQQPLPTVWCNRHRLKQVVTNLVRNAVKHGCDPQSPRIIISSMAEDHDAAAAAARTELVSFRVHDNGPGIDPRFQEEIFLPGRRLPGASEDGSGLGLAIVKKIVEHYGGSVGIDAEIRPGTSVVVSLPEPPGGVMQYHSHDGPSADGEIPEHHLDREARHDDHRLHPHPTRSRRLGHRGGR